MSPACGELLNSQVQASLELATSPSATIRNASSMPSHTQKGPKITLPVSQFAVLETYGKKAITSTLPHLSSRVPKAQQDLREQLPAGPALAVNALLAPSWEGSALEVLGQKWAAASP